MTVTHDPNSSEGSLTRAGAVEWLTARGLTRDEAVSLTATGGTWAIRKVGGNRFVVDPLPAHDTEGES